MGRGGGFVPPRAMAMGSAGAVGDCETPSGASGRRGHTGQGAKGAFARSGGFLPARAMATAAPRLRETIKRATAERRQPRRRRPPRSRTNSPRRARAGARRSRATPRKLPAGGAAVDTIAEPTERAKVTADQDEARAARSARRAARPVRGAVAARLRSARGGQPRSAEPVRVDSRHNSSSAADDTRPTA